MSAKSTPSHSFVFVPKNEYLPVKNDLIKLIEQVQNAIGNNVKFTYKFVGSASRDMITKDLKANIGYDFDLNIIIDPNEKNYDPKSLKDYFRNQFNKYVDQYGYSNCEDSTSVFTIKKIKKSEIIHSADFAIVRKFNGVKQVIVNHKDKQTYSWDTTPKYPQKLSLMAKWCEENHLWDEVKKKYLQKKNENTDENKKSRMIYADTVNEIYNSYHRK